MTIEGIRLLISKYWRKGYANQRKKKLKNDDFTIISNNCWGGMIYESYNMKKNTPTVGLFFMAEDYIKFLSHLEEYLDAPLVFIEPDDSKYKDDLSSDGRWGSYPVGLLKRNVDDEGIEIFFLHGHTKEEALDKWTRRTKRVNFDNLLIKMNDNNNCTEEHAKQFSKLPYKNKVFFTMHDWNYPSVIKIKVPKRYDTIPTSYEPFGTNRKVNVTKILNNLVR